MKEYVIAAPSFVSNSGGIKVLHRLCHELNEVGQKAYICPMSNNNREKFNLNPEYNTSIANAKILKSDPIVVYPEIVSGNPLHARNVVRWLLNKPGVIGGDGIYGDEDIIFYYNVCYAEKSEPVNILRILGLADDFFDVFRDYGQYRSGSCYVIHKGDRRNVQHNLENSLEITDITPSKELADIFNSRKIFYSYDAYTFLSALAVLCGCISIVIPGKEVDEAKWRENSPYGVGFGMDDITHAGSTMHLLKPHLQQIDAESHKQLLKFIEITQEVAKSKSIEVKTGPIVPLTSIIILTFNQLAYTKECVKSIRQHTPEPHEIIFVDNGSTDGTVAWLKKLARENVNYTVIENKKNLGFPKGCNQGIEASRGEFILLLNNDVVVAQDWLSGLLDCLHHAPDAGIVGPMTNNISGSQQVNDGSYRSVNVLDEYAGQFREKYRHRRIPSRKIVGFCMLFKRTLAEQIGGLDESFGTGNFEDNDYCVRALLDGYNNYIAGDVFIHHYGSRSFAGNNIDYSTAMSDNRKIFDQKWTLSSHSPDGKRLMVLNATESAQNLFQQEKMDQAVETLIDCIKITPDDEEIYYELARMFVESKKFGEAFAVVEQMPEAAKDTLKGLTCAGYSKEGLGLDDEANVYADKMLTINANYPSAFNLKGVLAHKKGEKDTAAHYFKKAIDVDPGYGAAYSNLGVLYWGMDQKDKARIHLQKGFVLSPTVPDTGLLYYSVVSSLGLFADAEADFREASLLYPNNKNLSFLFQEVSRCCQDCA